MSKVRTNQKFRLVAKMLKDIDQAEEVFIESPWNNQMIKKPLTQYGSNGRLLEIFTFDDYGNFIVDLNKKFEIQGDRNAVSFTYWIEFADQSEITITNEW
jgi:hypothetical protein